MQFFSLGLISEMITSHHEERARARGRARRGSPVVATPLRVLYFGTYERDYPRNAQVISCLRGAGVEVVERHVPVWEGASTSSPQASAQRLGSRSPSWLLRRPCRRAADALVVGYPGHFDLAGGARGARGRPVVFNPLVSLADTLVDDRGRFAAARCPRARCAPSTARRFAPPTSSSPTRRRTPSSFREPRRERVAVCFVGAEERVFRPGWTSRQSPSPASSSAS